MIKIIPSVKQMNFNIVQIGVGGNGSYTLQFLTQLISTMESSDYMHITIADPDVVEKKNLKNQYFMQGDVGKSKAQALAQRYSSVYGVQIGMLNEFTKQYVQTIDDIGQLFDCHANFNNELPTSNILISCVDNMYSRTVFNKYFTQAANLIYIDVGNDAIEYGGYDKSRENSESGWSGQVVVGVKMDGELITKPFAGYFAEQMSTDDNPGDASCQQAISSNPQRIYTNRLSATVVNGVLNGVLGSGVLQNM